MIPRLNAIIGQLYIALTTLFLMVNIVLLVITSRSNEFKTGTYRIIKNICVACIMQLIPFFVGGFMTLMDSSFNFYVDKILGAVLESSWFLYLGLAFTLALDRMLIFNLHISSLTIRSVNWTLLMLSWLFWLCAFIILLQPCFGYSYDGLNGHFVWAHTECRLSVLFIEVEKYLDFVFFTVELGIYAVVFVYILKLKNLSSQAFTFKAEIRIIFIAAISFLYESLFIIWSFWIPGFLDDLRAMDIVTSFMWIVDSGLFATVTMLINHSLRTKVKAIILTKF